MPIPNYPIIKDVKFSEDDRTFFKHQADKLDLLKGFVILLAGASAGTALLGTVIRNGDDLVDFLVNFEKDIITSNWGAASQYILMIRTSQAITDTQYHLNGVYSADGTTLKAPTGQAKKFFKNLLQYYSDVRPSP